MENPITTGIIILVVGIIITLIGISNIRGNLSAIHAYHTKNITEEDKPKFGKVVGAGHIIIGISLIINGISYFLESSKHFNIYTIGNIVLITGTIVGLVIIFYSLFKYNRKSK